MSVDHLTFISCISVNTLSIIILVVISAIFPIEFRVDIISRFMIRSFNTHTIYN